ncbi:hypothetical protein RQP46_006117 [Phenoliferia psychrophenolica]
MDELEHALASAALHSEDSDAAAPEPGASSSPVLPPELVADIIDLTVELLVEKERNLPFEALLTNKFLLSAALVNHTWKAMAISALLKKGIVPPDGVDGYIALAEKYGVRQSVDGVRFGAGAMGAVAARQQSGDAHDEPFQILISALPNLRNLELVGRLRFWHIMKHPFIKIKKLIMSSTSAHELRKVFRTLSGFPPGHLSIIETQPTEIAPVLEGFFLISGLSMESIDISSKSQISDRFYYEFILRLGLRGAPCLRRLRLELAQYHEPNWRKFCAEMSQPDYWLVTPQFPLLNHLETHLLPLHFFATFATAGRPSLASLEVLPDAESEVNQLSHVEAESKVLDLVQQLPVLRNLKVPACWRSDAVDDACEARGVDLRWT